MAKMGRPKGKKDSKPRQRKVVPFSGDQIEVQLSVEQQIRRLTRPVRVSTLSAITNMSKALIRSKIAQGKIRAFKRSGVVLIEPCDFLEYWLGGKNGKIVPADSRLFDPRILRVN